MEEDYKKYLAKKRKVRKEFLNKISLELQLFKCYGVQTGILLGVKHEHLPPNITKQSVFIVSLVSNSKDEEDCVLQRVSLITSGDVERVEVKLLFVDPKLYNCFVTDNGVDAAANCFDDYGGDGKEVMQDGKEKEKAVKAVKPRQSRQSR